MPPKNEIIKNVLNLPLVDRRQFKPPQGRDEPSKGEEFQGYDYSDEQIYEGQEGNGSFKVTHERMYQGRLSLEGYFMSVSGDVESINRIVDDFTIALGRPLVEQYDPLPRGPHFFGWLADEVKKRRLHSH